jgi:argininosuccinate lyase
VSSHLAALHGVLHALPLTYSKDLQEDKQHIFDAADTLELVLAAAHGMLAGARFARERMADAAADELIAATDIADLLVRRGLPFREAHSLVAGLVRRALADGRALSDFTPPELAEHSPLLGHDDYYRALEPSAWLESKISEGGTALVRVREQLQLARITLAEGA